MIRGSDQRLHTSVIEGINNKIKVTKRMVLACRSCPAPDECRGPPGRLWRCLWTPRLAATQPARPILLAPPRTPSPSPPPQLSVAPARSIAEPRMQTPAPFPVTRAAPDRRPRLTAGKPTAGVAGHSHSLLDQANGQPPPRVAASPSPPPQLSVAPARSIAEPRMQTPAPFPVTRAAPDRRPRLTAGKPTAGVAGHSHSLLRQPPPRVAARGRCRGSRCGLPPASSRPDTRPAPAPFNASPPPLRVAAHDSGPPWVATTTLPVFAGAQEVHMILKEPHAPAA